MSVIVFDLDDTLFEEISYVKSGFRTVAKFLEDKFRIPEEDSYEFMVKELFVSGRGSIFNDLLQHFNLLNTINLKSCLANYRTHIPEIKLFADTDHCLKNLKDKYSLYIVTDGNKVVQNNKLIALNLYNKMKFCYITHRYGVKNAKPSPYVFHKICLRENVTPEQVIYIGDNPNKDFVGIKPEGFRTIRILRGNFSSVKKSTEYEADYRIKSLDELTPNYINIVFKQSNI